MVSISIIPVLEDVVPVFVHLIREGICINLY